MTHRVALVTHDLSGGGGVASMTDFLFRVLSESNDYQPQIVSLAMSVSDRASVRVRAPRTWLKGVQIHAAQWRHLSYLHVGALATEFEPQRYKPRVILTQLLESYDLVQFVVGNPPYACVGLGVTKPLLLWTATTARADRFSQMRKASRSRKFWSSLMVPITEKYEKRSLQAVHTVFALSEYTRLAVEPIAGAGKVLLAPCGVDTELFRPSNCPSGDYIVSVARFTDPRKNVRLLLDAYAKLNQEMTPIPDLYLVGDLPTQDVQLHIQKFGIANRVRLIGPKQGEELAELYRNASFFVLSSDEEGLAIVILEAMASGLPVISTDCGGPRTSVLDGQTGFLTPLNDASAMAERMERLVRDPALRVRMGEEGRRLAKDRFSLPVTSDVFLRKYDELLNQGAGSQ